MSMNVSTTSVSSTSQVASGQVSENTQKSTTDSSFKNEMKKVETENKKEVDKTTEKEIKTSEKQTSNSEKIKVDENSNILLSAQNTQNLKLEALSMTDINNNLANDIEMMMNTNNINDLQTKYTNMINNGKILQLDYSKDITMSQEDAEFFINLTQNSDITPQAIATQIQATLDSGANLTQVQKSAKISETLLNAINIAKETNQPLRIDFDQNIAVIMRIGKDGSFSANFIPGDKVVEQYLKNNIDTLKSTFEEKELPYTELSYSNRGSKQQKEQRKNQQ